MPHCVSIAAILTMRPHPSKLLCTLCFPGWSTTSSVYCCLSFSSLIVVLCSCRFAGGTEDILLVPEVTSFQPWSSWNSSFHIQICTDSAFTSVSWVFRLFYLHRFGEVPVNFFLITSDALKSISSCSSFCWQQRPSISVHFLQARSPPCPSTPVQVRGPR